MRSAAELLEELNAVDESIRMEAKRASEIGKSVLQTVIAYTNEPNLGGGYLLLGADWKTDDKGDVLYWAAGISDPDKIQRDSACRCASMLSVVVRPEMRVEFVTTLEVRQPLLLGLRQIINAIVDELPRGFRLDEGALQSRQQAILPEQVIREALANAVMHRSYQIHSAVQVIRYAKRIEVINPGFSLKAVAEQHRVPQGIAGSGPRPGCRGAGDPARRG